ncbi:MAG: hypothetical protein GY866_39045 [Proteobacteria bacterium]|nr:hypothetical protein [Pseudomonadota bacterium]
MKRYRSERRTVTVLSVAFLALLLLNSCAALSSRRESTPEFDQEGAARSVWLVSNSVKAKNWTRSSSPGPVGFSLNNKFGHRYYIAREGSKRIGRKVWYPLIELTPNSNVDARDRYRSVAWVEEKDLLLSPTPLRDNQSSAMYKALLVDDRGRSSNSKTVFLTPELNKRQPARPQLENSVFYVYDAKPRFGGIAMPELARAVLIGGQSGLDSSTNKRDNALIGWIDRKSVVFWKTRLALEIRGRTRAYNSKVAARGHKDYSWIFNIPNRRFKAKTHRYPVLEADRQKGLYRIAYLEDPDFRYTTRGYQDYRLGWINTRNRTNRMNDHDEVQLVKQSSVIILLGSILEMVNTTPKPKTLPTIWGKLISQYTGKKCKSYEKIGKCLKEGGKITIHSPIVNYSLDELGEMLQKRNSFFYKEIRCPLKKTAIRLQGLVEEKTYAISNKDKNRCDYTKEVTGSHKIWFSTDNRVKYAWIKTSDLP